MPRPIKTCEEHLQGNLYAYHRPTGVSKIQISEVKTGERVWSVDEEWILRNQMVIGIITPTNSPKNPPKYVYKEAPVAQCVEGKLVCKRVS